MRTFRHYVDVFEFRWLPIPLAFPAVFYLDTQTHGREVRVFGVRVAYWDRVSK